MYREMGDRVLGVRVRLSVVCCQRSVVSGPLSVVRGRRSAAGSFVTLALLLITTALSFGQVETLLTGRVADPQNAGVPGAVVKLYSRDGILSMSVTTDATGAYRFERLLPGEYIAEAHAPGFAPAAARLVVVVRGQTTSLDISLPLASIREEVVVTASGRAQPADEVSKAVIVVSQDEINARDESTIPEALRTTPGLRIQQLGGPGALVTIKTRGLRNEDTAILVDGVRFRDAAAPQGDASGFLADLVVTNVDRLEVLRGSGSSLYGSNAIGGAINIVTDEGGGRPRGSLLLEGGKLGLFRGRAQAGGGLNNDRISYSAGLSHLNVTGGVDGDDAARNTSGQGKVSVRLSPTATLSARIYAADSFVQVNTSPQAAGNLTPGTIVPARSLSDGQLRRYESGAAVGRLDLGAATFIPSANDPDSSGAGHFFSGLVTLANKPAESFSYSLTYQGLVTGRTARNGPGGVSFQPLGNTRSDFEGRVHTVSARANFQLGRFSLVDAGYEFESENYVNGSFSARPEESSAVDVTQRSNSLFVQEQLRLWDNRLQLSTAFRAQVFSLDRPQFTPSTSAPYQSLALQSPPNAYTGDGSIAYFFRQTGTKIRGHIGNGYRAPSLFERFGTSFSSFGYFVFGDPRLRPDRSMGVDVGLDQTLISDRLRASGAYFYTRLQETIIFDFSGAISPATDPFGRFGGYRNAGGGLARGFELSAKGAPSASLDLTLAYTYTNTDQRRPLVGDVLRSFVVPNHQFSISATQRIGRRVLVNFDLTASSDYLAPVFDPGTFASRVYRFDDIAKADLGISYRVPIADARAIRFQGKVDNLFDRRYYESGFRTPGATAIGGVVFEF